MSDLRNTSKVVVVRFLNWIFILCYHKRELFAMIILTCADTLWHSPTPSTYSAILSRLCSDVMGVRTLHNIQSIEPYAPPSVTSRMVIESTFLERLIGSMGKFKLSYRNSDERNRYPSLLCAITQCVPVVWPLVGEWNPPLQIVRTDFSPHSTFFLTNSPHFRSFSSKFSASAV